MKTVNRLAKAHKGLQPMNQSELAPRPSPGNALAWRAWGLCFPDCRAVTMSGMGFWDWSQIATVVGAWGLDLDSDLHRKLRFCLIEAMRIEKDQRELEKSNGK